MSFSIEYWVWIKSAHIIAVIAWMAGLLYLPRLFVYHAEAGPGSETAETLKVMERRLERYGARVEGVEADCGSSHELRNSDVR